MKAVIANPFTPIPKSDKSHVKGWALMWAQRLSLCNNGAEVILNHKGDSILWGDNVYLDHGVNFSGGLNLFGGLNDEVVERLVQWLVAFEQFEVEMFSLDYMMLECDYETQIRKRLGSKTTSSMLNCSLISRIERMFDSMKTVTMRDLNLPKAIIGDSHSVAYSMPDQRIEKINGQTLYGALQYGLVNFIMENGGPGKELDLCLGSIDIRHHVFRHEVDARKFARTYATQVSKAQDHFETAINVCLPVPVEWEGRKIPGTGQYKKTNFFGSGPDRRKFLDEFMDELSCYVEFDVISPPREWYDMSPKEYANTHMEANSSVHIAPSSYRSIMGWE